DGVPGDGAALTDLGRRGIRRWRAGQVFSDRGCPRALQAVGLASPGRIRRHLGGSLSALSRRWCEGARLPRIVRERGGYRPGRRSFPLAAARSACPAAAACFFALLPGRPVGSGIACAGHLPPRSKARRGSCRCHAARRRVHDLVLAALRLVFRLAGAVPLLLSRRRRGLPDLRLRLPLLRALAPRRLGRSRDLWSLRPLAACAICAARPAKIGREPCRPGLRSIRVATSKASEGEEARRPSVCRSASISRPPTAAFCCVRPARVPTRSSSRRPT